MKGGALTISVYFKSFSNLWGKPELPVPLLSAACAGLDNHILVRQMGCGEREQEEPRRMPRPKQLKAGGAAIN